jgi:hypothetical protein
MKQRIYVAILFALGFSSSSLAAPAGIDPKVHKLCLDAKDYSGCVNAHAGESLAPRRLITDIGNAVAGGNQCPTGFAYTGGGYCQEVKCEYNPSGFNALGHDQIVAGKPGWKCNYSFWHGAGVLRLGQQARAYENPGCPSGEPGLGHNSTCPFVESKVQKIEGSRTPNRLGDR